jgi:hypothetical protein
MPAFDRMTKLPAVPRFTVAGPAANAAMDPERPNAIETANTVKIELLFSFFMCFIS